MIIKLISSSQTMTGTGIQGWGEYYSGTLLVQNSKHEYTKNIVLEYYSSTDFPVLVLVCSVLAPALLALQWLLCHAKIIHTSTLNGKWVLYFY